MFGRKDTPTMKKDTSLEKREIKAFLGPGSQFEGKLVFDEIVRLDGAFRGEITSRDTLIVGDTADLQAQVMVGALIISGKLKGNIKAVSRVELRSPARIDGDIETPVLVIEEGVTWNGSVTMKKPENAPRESVPAPKS